METTYTYLVKIFADYGPLPPSGKEESEGAFGQLSALEELVNRLKKDLREMNCPPSYTNFSLGGGNGNGKRKLVLCLNFPLDASEKYADFNLNQRSWGGNFLDLSYFLPIWPVLFNSPQSHFVDRKILPSVRVNCPPQCYDFVEKVMNYHGKTMDARKAGIKADDFRTDAEMGIAPVLYDLFPLDLK